MQGKVLHLSLESRAEECVHPAGGRVPVTSGRQVISRVAAGQEQGQEQVGSGRGLKVLLGKKGTLSMPVCLVVWSLCHCGLLQCSELDVYGRALHVVLQFHRPQKAETLCESRLRGRCPSLKEQGGQTRAMLCKGLGFTSM